MYAFTLGKCNVDCVASAFAEHRNTECDYLEKIHCWSLQVFIKNHELGAGLDGDTY